MSVTTYEVMFTIQVPDDIGATDEQVRRWVLFEIEQMGALYHPNPLIDHGLGDFNPRATVRRLSRPAVLAA